jgi:hypothetical protein
VKKSIDEYDGEAGTNLTLPLACGLGGACDEIERLRADNERLREAAKLALSKLEWWAASAELLRAAAASGDPMLPETLMTANGLVGNRAAINAVAAALATKGNDG